MKLRRRQLNQAWGEGIVPIGPTSLVADSLLRSQWSHLRSTGIALSTLLVFSRFGARVLFG